VLGGYAVVFDHPGLLGTRRVHTAHAVLLPGQRHGHAVDGKVDVVHDGAFFDQGSSSARRTASVAQNLLDHQLDVGSAALVGQDRDVFQAHQRLEDLTRVDKDEGASCFLAHTSSLKRLRLILGDLGRSSSPLKSEEPQILEAAPRIELG